MRIRSTAETLLIAAGDAAVWFVSLFFALSIRYVSWANMEDVGRHLIPFVWIWVIGLTMFYAVGAYDRWNILSVRALVARLAAAFAAKAVAAVALFYFIPFDVAPKTVLFIYLGVSLLLSFVWRVFTFSVLTPRVKMKAMLIAEGRDALALAHESERNRHIPFKVESVVSPSIEEFEHMYTGDIEIIIVDTRDARAVALLPSIYAHMVHDIHVVDFVTLFGAIFGRLPISVIDYAWVFENLAVSPSPLYDVCKRVIDVVISIFGALVTIVVFPFVAIGIKLQDGGPVILSQERIGRWGKKIVIHKFRTWDPTGKVGVTKFGKFLRATRIDELPQFFDIIRGALSIVGPRPELEVFVKHYEQEVPYYALRHIVTPGASGWAQIYHDDHPHHTADSVETAVKVSYDLYYIMNRSVILDFAIVLKSIGKMLAIKGK